MVRPDLVFVIRGLEEDYLRVSSDILLRTDPQGSLIQNRDVGGTSKGRANILCVRATL